MKLEELDLREVGVSIQMVGVVFEDARNQSVLVLPFPSESAPEPDNPFSDGGFTTLDMDLQEWQTFLAQTDKVEVQALVRAEDGSVGRAIVRKCERQISQHVSWAVYRRDYYRCRYCGNGEVPLTVDHLVLWEDGGPSTEANLVASCKKCNNTRGNTPYAEWLKSSYYAKVSRNLPPAIQEANELLVYTLGSIQTTPLKGKRKRR